MKINKGWSMVLFAIGLLSFQLFIVSLTRAADNLAADQVLNISLLAADIKTLDPHYASATADRILVDMVFNGLLRFKPGLYPEMEPDIATNIPKPEIVAGKQIWTFNIRKGVITHSFPGYPEGYEITSEDIVYSFKKAADPARSAWAGDYPEWFHFEAPDRYTVRVILDQPLSPTLLLPRFASYAGGHIIPKKAIEAIGDEQFKSNPIGTGPFALEKYLPRERVILKGHSRYFRGKPILKEVHGVLMADLSSAEMALMRGELQAMVGPTDEDWVKKMEGMSKIKVDIFGPGENNVLYLNTKKPPLNSLDVRRAICYALSRKEIVALFGERIATPTYSPIPIGFMTGGLSKEDVQKAGFSWEIEPNIGKAKELLSRAGFSKGFNIETYVSERDYYIKPMQVIQSALKKIGVNLKLNMVDHAAYHSLIRQDADPLVMYSVWRPNPDIWLTRFFHSSSAVAVGKSPDTNFTHGNLIDALIEKARFEIDPIKQETLWKEAQLALLNNAEISVFCLLKLTCARSISVDWGHPVKASMFLYPQIDEGTKLLKN
jgi:peptide/nickel transport system substrate-binding protein